MNIAKTLYQKIILVSLALAVLSLFLGFFSMKHRQEGLFVDTRYEAHAQLHNAVTGFKTHQIVFNRTGVVDHRVNFSHPNNVSRVFAIILLTAMLTGAIGSVWGSKKGAALSALLGVAGLVALYLVVQIEITPEEAKLKGLVITYETGFYLAITALAGYIAGGVMAFTKGAPKVVTAGGGRRRFCGECGAPAGDSGKFCGSCGSAIK